MASAEDEGKKVQFFQLQGRKGAETLRVDQTDWPSLLEVFGEASMEERQIGPFVFEPEVRNGVALLGVHRPLDTSYMTQLSGQHVSDLMDEHEQRGRTFAHSTAVRFMANGNVIAVARGGRDSPYATSVEQLAEVAAPFQKEQRGTHWKVVPLYTKGEVERFQREARGVTAFEATFRTMPDIFTQEPTAGVTTWIDELAHGIEGELEVKLSVKLSKRQSGDSARRGLRDLIGRDRDRLSRDQKPLRVKMVTDAGAEEWIDLVAHQLADTIELTAAEMGERRTFSALMDHLDDVGGEYEDRVRAIVGGR